MSSFVIGLVVGITIPYIIAYVDLKYHEYRDKKKEEEINL
jgi:uncharacterized membrane-anchored protein YhcB (DUF1043 family)